MPQLMPLWLVGLIMFIFGAVVGSFLNVCIYRLPRDMSLVRPPSHCPGCGGAIRPWDNIPILSWFLLRGRCRRCSQPISPVYPLVETLNASLWALYVCRFGLTRHILPYFILASAMIVITFIDLEHWIIPDVISLPGSAVGLALTPLLPHSLVEGVIGLASGAAFFYLVAALSRYFLKKEGMGGGDIKLAAMMGAFLGWKLLVVAVFWALFLGSAVGLTLIAIGKRRRQDAIPFGPFLAAGTILATFWGEAVIAWYLTINR